MTDVINIFWPLIQTSPTSDASAPEEISALLSDLSGLSEVTIRPATPIMMEDISQEAPGPYLVTHLTYVQGALLAFEIAVQNGLEDSAKSFAIFASESFASFRTFRQRWIRANPAETKQQLNLARLANAPAEEIETLLHFLAPGAQATPQDVERVMANVQPLLDRVSPKTFRYYDDSLFATLRQIKLSRTDVIETFQDVMKRAPKDDQILFFQTLPSLDRLRDSLMTSQEYLTRFGLSDKDINTSYELFFNRAPSVAEREQAKKTHPNLASLRKVFLKAPEFTRLIAQSTGSGGDGTNTPIAFKSAPALKSCDTDRVVFLHIPKCGGTTLHNMLRQWFSPENVHPERFNGLYGYTGANLASSTVFSGHYDYYATTLIPGPKKLISILRDPLDRLVSLYNFHRAHSPAIIERSNLTLPRWANEHNIDAYFSHPKIREHPAINNSIVRYFSDTPQIAPSMKGDAFNAVTLDEMLDQALRNLEKFAFVGFMDQYDTDMNKLADTLGRDRPDVLRKHQVLDDLMTTNPDMQKIEKQKPSPTSRAEMESLIAYDRLFYARAREIFT